MTPEWYESHDNLLDLGSRLADDGMEARELLGFFEKPWKWDREWKFRDQHSENCAGITSCEIEECEGCYDDLPECQLDIVECADSDYDLCEKCRALPEYAPAPEFSEVKP